MLRALLAVLVSTVLAAGQESPPPPALTLPAFTGFAHPDPDAMRRGDDGSVTRCSGELVFYFHCAHTGALTVEIEATADHRLPPLTIALATHPHGEVVTATATAAFTIAAPGYHRLTLRAADETPLRHLARIHLRGPAAADAHASTVERRNAASVHLGYDVPKEHRDHIEWFYCEVTPRTDPLYTYYMATGWSRGYFGMQVNSPTERRIIFSVWDAGNEAVDRNKVADDNKVELIAKGDGVHAGGFGNEGTGGHSHLVRDWHLGETFRFLVHAKVDGTHTTYTGWFWFAERNEWGLIASFRAPKDGRRLRGLYSFNENFAGKNGDLLRDCEFGNVWVRPQNGEWLALQHARFTHDGHGKSERLDRSAGVRGARFYLQNGGFVASEPGAVTKARDILEVAVPPGQPPATLPIPPPTQNAIR